MNLKNIINKTVVTSKSKIWTKYIRFILPIILFLVLGMNIAIYKIVSKNIVNNTMEMAFQSVNIQSDNISNIIYRYIDDLNVLKSYYNPNDINGFIDKTNAMLYNHTNEWAYLRITTPDGQTWTNYTREDTVNTKIRKYFREIFIEKKDISFRMSHHTDIIKDDIFSVTIPVKDNHNGEIIASLSSTFSTKKMDQMLEKLKVHGHGFVALIDENLNMRVLLNDCYNTTAMEMEKKGNEGFYKLCHDFINGYKTLGRGEYYNQKDGSIIAYMAKIKGTPWFVCINITNSALNASVRLTLKIIIALAILTLILIVISIKIVTDKYVLKPLENINTLATDLSKGELTSSDRIKKAKFKSNDEFSELYDKLLTMQDHLVDIVKNIKEYTEEFTDKTMDWAHSVRTVADDAKTQQTAVEEISESMDKIIESIKETGDKSQKTKDDSESIADDIQEITNSSENSLIYLKNVLTKIKIINEITTRTDLLAINAAVEASRAGDNGKGFAVVAAEIRKLSERCQQASADINRSSGESLEITKHTVELIDKISPKIRSMALRIADISEICLDQRAKTDSIHRSVTQLGEITANNKATADEMSDYSKQMKDKIDILAKSVEYFKIDHQLLLKRKQIIDMIELHTNEILQLKNTLIQTAENNEDKEQIADILKSNTILSDNKDTSEDGFGIFENDNENSSTKMPQTTSGVKIDMTLNK